MARVPENSTIERGKAPKIHIHLNWQGSWSSLNYGGMSGRTLYSKFNQTYD